MERTVLRRNPAVLRWVSAGGFAVLTVGTLLSLGFRPGWGAAAVALAAGLAALLASEFACVIATIAIGLTIVSVNPILGIIVLVVGLAATTYLAAGMGRNFMIVALSFIGAVYSPVWGGVIAAGLLLGVGESVVVSLVAALIVEAVGVALGVQRLGLLFVGAGTGLLDVSRMPKDMFDVAWLSNTFKGIDPKDVRTTLKALGAIASPLVLLVQPALWALGAAITSMAKKRTRELGILASNGIGALAGVAVLALGSALALSLARLPVPLEAIGIGALASLAVGLGFALLFDRLFPEAPVLVQRRPPAVQTVATDDADVDELLRLISTAEEKLTTEHTTQKVVMITDMKSFSAMTEQDGSVMTAKAIQKHRDLLLPVIERYGGCGKSTGGDGLVAAFDVRANALRAAADIQRTLTKYNEDHPKERELLVRAGIAQGEVVLDKHGRPFIGAGLNLAARVMNLADGGQAFVTAMVAQASGEAKVKVASLGDFELKNIQKPVEVFEILWAEGQEPRPPAR